METQAEKSLSLLVHHFLKTRCIIVILALNLMLLIVISPTKFLQHTVLEFRAEILNEYENSLTAATKQYLKNFKASNCWLQIMRAESEQPADDHVVRVASTTPKPSPIVLVVFAAAYTVPIHPIWNIDQTD